ncbi:hypothetical protein HSX11_08270 [Oxalobacteraceae bacterium]|nr:hypothetical protein [Oxalobacteraceae bacterium]
MDVKEREAARKLASHSFALDAIATSLATTVLVQVMPGTEIQGFDIKKTERPGALFECTAHRETVAAQYVHVRDGDDVAGRIHFCKVKLDGTIGDSLLAITVRANGDVEFPDGEDLDLWPKNNPDPNQVRRTISYQVLRAIQANLAAV